MPRISGIDIAQPNIELHLDVGNGHGSTNTRIRKFTNIKKNTLGSHATYATDNVNGMSVTINTAGYYSINYVDSRTAATARHGISVNAASLTTDIDSLSYANGKRIDVYSDSGPRESEASVTLYLSSGDIVRAHDDGSNDFTTDNCIFRIVKVL